MTLFDTYSLIPDKITNHLVCMFLPILEAVCVNCRDGTIGFSFAMSVSFFDIICWSL